jgi:hypothetical protein
VDEDGTTDPASLSARGWQRAGALAALFTAANLRQAQVPRPVRIYAVRPKPGNTTSRRSLQTVMPLAAKMGLDVRLDHAGGDEAALVKDAKASPGPVLICWKREGIRTIAAHIAGRQSLPIPARWPSQRFDLIWSFTLSANQWVLTQIPQNLLVGDADEPITRALVPIPFLLSDCP